MPGKRLSFKLFKNTFYSTADWVNPAVCKLIALSTLDGQHLPYGKIEDMVGRDTIPRICHTKENV